MTKLVQNDIASLTNEQSALAALNSNYASLEAFSDTVLSRDGTTPNQMGADLDMNGNDIINVGTINTSAGAAPSSASYVTLGTDATLTNERVLTAGTGISLTDGGAGNAITVTNTAPASDGDLVAVAALSGTGLATRTAADTWTTRTLTAPAAGITITNPAGIAGNPTLVLANDLASLEAVAATNSMVYRSAIDTWAPVTVGTNLTFSGGTLNATGGGGAGAMAVDVQNFTANGTWTKPAAAIATFIRMWSGGGGGGGGRGDAAGTNRFGGGGGGGGGYVEKWFLSSTLGATETVTVGTGGTHGTGGSSGNGTAGTTGGSSIFGSWVTLNGGVGGGGGTNASGLAGAGGTLSGGQGIGIPGEAGSQGGAGLTSGNGTPGSGTFTSGPGGGGGGGVSVANVERAGGDGGSHTGLTGGGGLGGAANGNPGANGTTATNDRGGLGGGAGGGQDSGTGGAGGTGATQAAGGGGGGAGTTLGGDGGDGARGEVQVWTFG